MIGRSYSTFIQGCGELTLSHRTPWPVFQPVPSPRHAWVKLSCVPHLGCRCLGVSPLDLSVDSYNTRRSRRGPSHFGSDELVGKYSKTRWYIKYTYAKNSCRVPHPKLRRHLSWHCTNPRKFSPSKVPRYTVLV